jgi:hypothetical protein
MLSPPMLRGPGRAMHYTLANWARLTRFVQGARVPLDNSATERGLRGPVVGRVHGSKAQEPA